MTRDKHIRLDPEAHAIMNGGTRSVLQHKVWQVLVALVESRPQVVTRQVLIDSLWSGQASTGDKGLNQALWTLRRALGDRAAAPRFIRTIPRQGYQWIGPPLETSPPAPIQTIPLTATKQSHWRWFTLIAVTALLAMALFQPGGFSSSSRALADTGVQSASGTHAYVQGDDIVVDHFRGCRLVLKGSDQKLLSTPLLSADGEQLAFQVTEDNACRLMLFEFPNQSLNDMGSCSGQGVDLDSDTI